MKAIRSIGIAARVVLMGAVLILLLLGCDLVDQQVLEQELEKVKQTALAEGKKIAATQVAIVKETAVQAIVTRVPALPELPVAKPSVQEARAKLKAMAVMECHWQQVDAPLKNGLGQRSAGSYADVIDQFEVEATAFDGRYDAGGCGNPDTRCNIFAGDVMRAMGVPLPTKGNLGIGYKGKTDSTYTDPMTAPAAPLHEYLNKQRRWVTSEKDPGVLSDWVEIDATTEAGLRQLASHVNEGKPALASDQGHIAVIRPNQSSIGRWQELVLAQAGATNSLAVSCGKIWSSAPQFFIHD